MTEQPKVFLEFVKAGMHPEGRPFKVAIELDSIVSLQTQVGSHNVYLEVNGIAVDASYEEVIGFIREYNRVKQYTKRPAIENQPVTFKVIE